VALIAELNQAGHIAVDRARTGSKHHLIYDGGGIPRNVITSGGNVNVTKTRDLVAGIRPVAGRPPAGRVDARRRCSRTRGYDSDTLRRELDQHG
jgi:hypothetical protein